MTMNGNKNVQFDNIATPGAPVWRGRHRVPLTCHEVRIELVRQATELPELERARYLNDRLTGLDKALSDDEARAVECWLDCEEILRGRARTTDYSGSGGGSFGPASPIASDCMEALEGHAEARKTLSLANRRTLAILSEMMEGRDWMLTPQFIEDVKNAARALLRFHAP
jgi:hypothetical protein